MFDPDSRPSVLRLALLAETAEHRAEANFRRRMEDPAFAAAVKAPNPHRPASQPTKHFHRLFDGFKRPTEQTDRQHLARVAQADPIPENIGYQRYGSGTGAYAQWSLSFMCEEAADPLDGFMPLDAPL